LHGHDFFVVRSAGNSTYNYDNPVMRDVVSMGDTGDNVTIRFFTDNAGPWFLHCHIDWHLERQAVHFSGPNASISLAGINALVS
jgi:iron transport multicopper oxidase